MVWRARGAVASRTYVSTASASHAARPRPAAPFAAPPCAAPPRLARCMSALRIREALVNGVV